MDDKLSGKFKGLTDSDLMAEKFGILEANNMDRLLPHKEEYEHGESIVTGKILFDLYSDEEYIKNVRFFDHVRRMTIIDFVTKNNRLILDYVRNYVNSHQR
jgi:hypothetical protein